MSQFQFSSSTRLVLVSPSMKYTHTWTLSTLKPRTDSRHASVLSIPFRYIYLSLYFFGFLIVWIKILIFYWFIIIWPLCSSPFSPQRYWFPLKYLFFVPLNSYWYFKEAIFFPFTSSCFNKSIHVEGHSVVVSTLGC